MVILLRSDLTLYLLVAAVAAAPLQLVDPEVLEAAAELPADLAPGLVV
jgi:hypothetical protein